MHRRTNTRRPAATPLVSLWAALVLVLALVGPVLANQGPTRLYDPAVSPRSGSPTTTIVFTVEYRNREGSAPDHVSVVIDGVAHAMTGSGGTNWKAGVRNTWSTKLPVGTHTISFEAADTRRFSDEIAGGTVTITAPTPTPTPAPTATPRPTATPTTTAAPTATPRPTSQPTATPRPTSIPAPTPRPTPTPAPATTLAPTATPGSTTGSGAGPGATQDPATGPGSSSGPDAGSTSAPGGTSAPGPDGSGPGAGTDDALGPDGTGSGPGGSAPGGSAPGGRDSSASGPGWGALSSALATLGIDRPPTITILPMLVGTTGAMTMAFAFAIFGKKRRDELPPAPDEVLRADAARIHETVPGVVRTAAIPALLDEEAGMPRWRRPSLIQARKADPARSTASADGRMSFDRGMVAAVDGRERRVIRYRVVRLLDAPDELRSADVGQLDQGDEVQLLEKSGTYWLVLCPDGRQGWLHKMTLGEIVTDGPPAACVLRDDEDDDVLTAFLQSRARA